MPLLEPTDDNPITDEDRRLAELIGADPKTIWTARQPLPPIHILDEIIKEIEANRP